VIKKLDHVAVAVKSIDETLSLYTDTLGLKLIKREDVPDQGVKAALIQVGDSEIELLEPLDPNGGLARFIERNGEGMHHLCLEVDDVNAELKALGEKGVQLIDKQGRPGLAGLVGFLHPRSLHGVLIELAQKTQAH